MLTRIERFQVLRIRDHNLRLAINLFLNGSIRLQHKLPQPLGLFILYYFCGRFIHSRLHIMGGKMSFPVGLALRSFPRAIVALLLFLLRLIDV
ncbi:hypothetical protein Lsai_0151 [Legionella sainthelensi]|uniref:Uncharacterized protein n=1 Tax=Legionella sainthelensi TaxID=28087 RepID=A0A0W0YU58_9GAMM|nr:hypothetical protein Lsai_0151 [Legionella sainthelensi]VEH34892.1 Uncharacterised protein [Legionella sainthelensi]